MKILIYIYIYVKNMDEDIHVAIINGPAHTGRAHVSNVVDDGMVGGPRGCTRPSLSHMGQSIVV